MCQTNPWTVRGFQTIFQISWDLVISYKARLSRVESDWWIVWTRYCWWFCNSQIPRTTLCVWRLYLIRSCISCAPYLKSLLSLAPLPHCCWEALIHHQRSRLQAKKASSAMLGQKLKHYMSYFYTKGHMTQNLSKCKCYVCGLVNAVSHGWVHVWAGS